MTKEEIKEKASEYVDSIRHRIDSYAYLDVQDSFAEGAEWMQEQQPYTAEDMKVLAVFVFQYVLGMERKNGIDYFIVGTEDTPDYTWLTFDKLLKHWKKQKMTVKTK